jgi:hypothetical protein
MTPDDDSMAELISNRKAAERVVEGMPDGPLKEKAFEIAFSHLLAGGIGATADVKPRKTRSTRKVDATRKQTKTRKGPKLYIEDLISDGFFDAARALPDVLSELGKRGHTGYRQANLSKPMQLLTQAKVLKREQRQRGAMKKKIWYYEKHPE